MEKLLIILLCMFSSMLVLFTPSAVHASRPNSLGEGPNELINWFTRVPQMTQKLTRLHFYLHDIVGGPNSTNIPVAIANATSLSPTFFGLIGVMDDLLTLGPSPNSESLGRAQGLLASASLTEVAYHMTLTFVFTSGEFNGSKLTVAGHNPFMSEYRELPIVGGSGAFRLAQGSVLLNTLTLNSTNGDAIVEYNVMVLHY